MGITFLYILLSNFIIASHGIATFIQLLPFNIYDFIHLISHYKNVHVVGNWTAFIQTQSLPPDYSMVIFIFTVFVLYLSHLAFWFFWSCFHYLLQCSECLIPLMIPTRCVEMYPIFRCAIFCRCCIQYNHPWHNNMCQLWSIMLVLGMFDVLLLYPSWFQQHLLRGIQYVTVLHFVGDVAFRITIHTTACASRGAFSMQWSREKGTLAFYHVIHWWSLKLAQSSTTVSVDQLHVYVSYCILIFEQ